MDALTVLITGASGGIGRATALRLAQPLVPPYKVKTLILHYNSDSSRTRSLTEQIHALDPTIRVVWLQADLASTEAAHTLYHQAAEAAAGTDSSSSSSSSSNSSSPINVLFANAGTHLGLAGPEAGSLEAVDGAAFEQTWRVNTLATYELTRLAAPGMAAGGFGRVIYTSSVAALTGGVVGPHYASSKAALHGMMHSLAGSYAGRGVTFNAVAPALVAGTAMLPGGEEELRKKIPVGRLGKAEEVAEVVVVMITNGYVSNKVWAVDGGMVPR
ncbi:NAD(P)-binding protein [Cryphonectria parasitica EP155]|uniref:NAD(P)-binding protein n=1 Tax=Cryphonectria parasitica (strain ATCC 38755 / EP155) TaxID=660469 RepID=A0A9P4XV83_CRYP1|nr:NAD(P)-binding protein [Cryphonectria parasitica EP155]KAF3761528.1 NAD(P)-binding protein [Cryphonectria parasitica EP155]